MRSTEPSSQVQPPATSRAALPSLAVVIPTLNRPRDLTITVQTLLEQTVLPQELVIVDQSLSDESERQVRALFAERAERVKQMCLRYTLDPGITGAATARNVALEQNHCNIILFLDDDVELEPDFVERLMEGYAEDPEVTGISGIITNYKPGGFGDRAWQWLFMRGPFRDVRQSLYLRAGELRGAGRIPVSRFGGGLMSFRANRISGLRFDPNLRAASEGEDVDFCLHLPAGARLEIEPRARLVHNKSGTARPDEHWNAAGVRGNTYLYYRNWRRGWSNPIAFLWLMSGFALLALVSSLKRVSLAPWKAFIAAVGYGREFGSGKK
jgi:GT2 family glycosyltransferase